MKTLMIERVTNGWIIRPFSPCDQWAVSHQGISVYRTISEIQEALPKLLADQIREEVCSKPA